jgi:hypothetical protein
MSEHDHPNTNPGKPAVYRIRIVGQLGPQWTEWFQGMTVTPQDNGDTLVTGPVVDQAALHGLLRKVRDLGLPLLSVTRLKREQPGQPDNRSQQTVGALLRMEAPQESNLDHRCERNDDDRKG